MRALIEKMSGAPERVLADSLAASGRYTIVAPPMHTGAMPDSAIRGAAPACEELACVVRAGREAGATRAATGRITRISDIIWLVSAALVDVESGRVRHAEESIEVKGDIGDLLPRVMASIARRFVAKDAPAYGAGGAAPAAPAAPAGRLTREDVARRLAAASDDAPPAMRAADLSGLDLAGLDFHGADLTGCRMVETRLAGARLFGATLSGCTMTGADLTGAMLDVAVLRGTDLTRATLRDASLYATILIGATLADAELSGARIIAAAQDARFTRARMIGVRMGADPGNQPMGVMRTDLTGADLAGADLSRADLRKANFTRADLTGATLAGADVTGADFASATLRSIRGRGEIRNLDRALNLDRAVGWEP
jgi:uncharacterized protein YjbI with pentapeptide repeats